jgi:O-antigen/teichoic acid export membrane protein
VVLRTLGAEDFGIYNVVGGAISMLGFINASMASTVQRYLNNAQGKNDFLAQKEIYNISVVFHVIIATAMLIILWIMQYFLFDGILNISESRLIAAHWVYFCLIVSTFFTIIGVPYDALINAHEDMLTYSIIGIIDIVVKLVIAILITFMAGDKLIIYSILMIAIPVLTYVMMKIYSIKHYAECVLNIKKYFNKTRSKEILGFAGWNLVGTSSGMIGNYGNNIVLNHFFGAVLNAASGVAIQLNGMLSVLSVQFLKALNPMIYKLGGASDSQKMQIYSYIGCKYSYLLLAALSIPVIIEAPYVLRLWLVDVPEWAVFFVRWTMIRALIEQLTLTLNRSLESSGHIKEYNVSVFVFYLTPLLFLTLIYKVGGAPYWNLYIPTVFMAIIPGIVKLYYCRRYCKFDISTFLKTILLQCGIFAFVATIIGVIPSCFIQEGFLRVVLTTILTTLGIIISFVFLLNANEKALLNPMIGKIKSVTNYRTPTKNKL